MYSKLKTAVLKISYPTELINLLEFRRYFIIFNLTQFRLVDELEIKEPPFSFFISLTAEIEVDPKVGVSLIKIRLYSHTNIFSLI